MARRTLTDMDAELLLRLGNRTDITSGMRANFIQDAYLRIARMYDHIELQGEGTETLSSGDDRLTPSVITDLWWPVQIKDDTEKNILHPEDKDMIDRLTKVSGTPRRFYWWGGVIVVDVLSNGDRDLAIKYKKKPVEIVTSSVLDEIYDLCIILRAAQIGAETVRDMERAVLLESQYRKYAAAEGLIPAEEEQKNTYQQGIRVRMR